MEKPDGIAQLGTLQFYAVRIESACHVIKKVKNITFKVEEIRRALRLGARTFIAKEFKAADLERQVEEVVNAGR